MTNDVPGGRVILLGATGYTGRLTVEELVAAGCRPVLVGRDPVRLAAMGESSGGLVTRVVDITAPGAVEALRELLRPGDVLISTVGPFARLGSPAVQAAARAGVTYLDSTGEPSFVRRVFEEFGPQAERTGATLLTAFGYDYVPGNLAAELVLRAVTERGGAVARRVRRVEIGYFAVGGVGSAISRGTARSVAGVLGEPVFGLGGGVLRSEPAALRVAEFVVAGRRRTAVSIGASEHFALPRLHPELSEVDVYAGWFGAAGRLVHRTALLGIRMPALVRGARRLAAALAERVPAEPAPDSTAHIAVVAVARDARGRRLAEVELRGGNPYRFTARMLSWAARTALEEGVRGPGAVGPVEAFGVEPLRRACADAGLVRVRGVDG
ncbi:MAG TPA: saccharopine dehydrogenase NADP-binding domain-containing protein [Pseudonocardiaceae bacterium]